MEKHERKAREERVRDSWRRVLEKAKEQKVDLAGFIEPGTHRITHTHTLMLQLNTGLEAFHFTNNNNNKIK